MDALQVVEALSEWEGLPVDAIRAAQADRETMAPVFLLSIEEFLSLEGEPVAPAALFFMSASGVKNRRIGRWPYSCGCPATFWTQFSAVPSPRRPIG